MGSIWPSHFCGQKKGSEGFSVLSSRSCFFCSLVLSLNAVFSNPSVQLPCASCMFPWFSVFCLNSCRILSVLQTSFPALPVASSFDRFSSGMLHLNFLPFLRFILSCDILALFHGLSSYISCIQSPHHFVAGFCFCVPSFLCEETPPSISCTKITKCQGFFHTGHFQHPFIPSLPLLCSGFHESMRIADRWQRLFIAPWSLAPMRQPWKMFRPGRGDSHRKKIWFHDDFMWWFDGDLIK